MITKMFEIVSEIHRYFWPFFLDLFLWNYDLKRKKTTLFRFALKLFTNSIFFDNIGPGTLIQKKNNHDVIAT